MTLIFRDYFQTISNIDLRNETVGIYLSNWHCALLLYTCWKEKLSLHFFFLPMDPIVNEFCCVGSLGKRFHPDMMLISYSCHKSTSFLNIFFIDKFPFVLIGVKNLQEYLRLICNTISMGAKSQMILQMFNPYAVQWKIIN